MNLYGHKVNQLARNFAKKLNEKVSPLGLFSSQWGIVLFLYEKKYCTQTELSQYLSVEAPTITRTLARMEEMGWVIREEGKNKREKHIRLTKKALEMFPKWQQSAMRIEVDVIKNIDNDELEIFNNVLNKMMKNLEKEE